MLTGPSQAVAVAVAVAGEVVRTAAVWVAGLVVGLGQVEGGKQGSPVAVGRRGEAVAGLVVLARPEQEQQMSPRANQESAGRRVVEEGAIGRWHRPAGAPVAAAPLPWLDLS